MKDKKAFFITGTDTDVGKTYVTFALAVFLQDQGLNVGVMKPVQCSGRDTEILEMAVKKKAPRFLVNPYYAPDPLSPNVAFARIKKTINPAKIRKAFQTLYNQYDVLLVEGAGGLLVPLKEGYLMADLVSDLGCELLIVSRLGLGTINHTLLTIEEARKRGLPLRGVIFNASHKKKPGIAEKTNPDIVKRLGDIPVIGIVPHLSSLKATEIRRKKVNFNMTALFPKRTPLLQNDYAALDKKYVWHPFTQMKEWLSDTPLVIERGEGIYLIDTQGGRYLDGVSSLWVNVHGHRHKRLDMAVRNQLQRVAHTTLLGLANVPSIELAKELTKITPKGLTKVFYSDNGSTAVEVAIKMAYQYWQNKGEKKKKKILHLENSYHGDTLGSVSVGGIGLFHQIYKPLTFPTIQYPSPYFYRSGYKSKDRFVKDYAAGFRKLLEKEGHKIAALVVEPLIQAAAGMIVWPRGILREMAELCRQYQILLIADEVATGFGRTGKMFACEHEGVAPDFLCLAKGITGGYLPLAVTVTTEKIFEGFLYDYKDMKTFFHGHTYTGNPLACAAALANLMVFKEEKTLYNLKPKIRLLAEELKRFSRLAHVGDIRQKGFMVGIELVADKKTKRPFSWEEKVGVKVCQYVRQKGVILRPLGNVIVLMPPLAIKKKELKKLLDVTYWAIAKVTVEK